ncbi:uncharacterized protein LOC141905532 [Tubulanus polymorphus]|uniref:uncharacterized protein LOC141905532 n=1 Tax=Tubulanus polymorphus TaxID=672921 RepID=UPI003DA65C87
MLQMGKMDDDTAVQFEPVRPAGLPAQMAVSIGFEPQFTTFSELSFDPQSQNVLNQTHVTHQSHQRLKASIISQASMLQQMTRDQFSSMQDRMTYETLLNGLLFQGEGVLNNFQYLYYTHVEFLSENGTEAGSPLLNGRALLTDRRLLLMSAEITQNAKLEQYGDPKKTPGGYHVTASQSDATSYKPIPLHNFYSIELHTASGVRAEQNINAEAPCCCGIFGCCFGLTGMARCTKTWHPDMPLVNSYNERIIFLGTTLPPWGTRSMIKIHIHPNVSLTLAKDFVSALQCFAGRLH